MLSVHQGWAFVPFPRTGGVPNALGNKTYTKVDVKNNRQVLVAIHAGVGGTGSSTAGPLPNHELAQQLPGGRRRVAQRQAVETAAQRIVRLLHLPNPANRFSNVICHEVNLCRELGIPGGFARRRGETIGENRLEHLD